MPSSWMLRHVALLRTRQYSLFAMFSELGSCLYSNLGQYGEAGNFVDNRRQLRHSFFSGVIHVTLD
jgi:hypothetical protein